MNTGASSPAPPRSSHRSGRGAVRRRVIVIALVAIYVLLSAGAVTWTSNRMRAEFLGQVLSEAEKLDISVVRALKGAPSDKKNPAFQKLLMQLGRLVMSDPDYRYAYLMRKTEAGIIFLMDAQNEIFEETAPLDPGTPFEDATPGLRRLLEDPPAAPFVEGPARDEWGVWVSALVPLVDPQSGKVTAVFGMDIDAGRWNRELVLRSVPPLSVLTVLLIVGLAVVVLLSPHEIVQPRSVTARLLPPVLLSQLVLFAGFVVFAAMWQQANIERIQQSAVDRIAGNLEVLLMEREASLRAAVHALQMSEKVQELLAEGDKEAILREFSPIFEKARQEFGLDMFYWIAPDGKVLARLHEPGNSGGFATDGVYLDAKEKGDLASGIGVGFWGRAALRVAAPVRSGDRLLGWVELGSTISDIAKALRISERMGIAIALRKEGLNSEFFRPDPGRNESGHWDQYPEQVVIFKSSDPLPEAVESYLQGLKSLEEINRENRKSTMVFARYPLLALGANQIGSIYVYMDASFIQADYRRFLALVFSIGGMVFVFVTAVLLMTLRRTDDSIRAQTGELIEVNRRLETEKRKADLLRVEAERANSAKSEFLAVMSHELRNPLAALLGVNEMLSETDLDSEQRELVDLARDSAATMLTLVGNTLDISKIEAGALVLERVPFDPRKLAGSVVAANRPAALRKGLDIALTSAEDIPETVLGDHARLRQILQNLVGNALKFTQSGSVQVSIQSADGGEQTAGRRLLRFEVADTGIGIPEDKTAVIFERYRQAEESTARHYGGTGLGLSICKELVGLMGGTIGVESKPGHGSTFWFEIPFDAAVGGSAGTSSKN